MSLPVRASASRRFRFGSLLLASSLFVGLFGGVLGVVEAAPAGAAGVATQVAFTTSPTTVVAGATMTAPVVQLRDSGNNNVLQSGVSVSVAINTGPGTFDPSAITSETTNSSGQAIFSNLVFDTAGSYTLIATSTGLTSKVSGSFTVSVGAIEQIALTTVPSTVVSGASVGIGATAEDAYGNKESTLNTGSVTLSVATGPAGGALAGTVTRTWSGGAVAFSSTLTTVGNYTLTASYTDPVAGLLTATTGSIAVTAGVAKKLGFTQAPSTTNAGNVMTPSPTVQVEDANGNAVADTGVTITISSTGTLTAGSTKTATTDVNGVATFSNLVWNTAGTYTLTAAATSLTSGTSGSFSIVPGAPVNLVFTTQPGAANAGSAVPTTVVKVEDSLNNVITTSTDSVTLSPNGPGGFDPSSTTTVAAVNGVATFSNLVLDKSGSYTLSATTPDGAVGTSHSFAVSALAATQLVFVQGPNNNTAGTVQTPNVSVAAEDQYGNASPSASGTVTLTTSPSVTVTSGTHALSSGVATFSAMNIQTAGTYTLTASLPSLPSVTSGSFTIAPNVPYQLVYGTQPTNITAGQTIAPSPTVNIEDHFANIETADSTDTVTLAGSVAAGSTATETAVNGVATFPNVTIDTVGNVTHTLTATSPSTPTIRSATSASFTVSPGAPTTLAIVQPQLGGQVNTGNSIGTFYLEQYDQYGNNSWGSSGTPLTFSSSFSGGTFSLTQGGPSTTTATFPYPPNNNNPPNNRDLYFYYGDTNVGLPTITVSSPGLTSATQQVEIINVESPGNQTSNAGTAITPLVITGQNSSPAYPFTSWSATGLPTGLSIDNTGTITGTPTTLGTYTVEVYGYEGQYAYGYTSFSWTIVNTVTVTDPGPQSSVVGAAITPLPIATSDSSPSATLSYSDNGTLPPGLSIDPDSGIISGAPTAAATYPVEITVTDNSGFTGTTSFSWTTGSSVTVNNPGPQTSGSGAAITPLTITASDTSPTATLTYSDGGSLPPGLSIDAGSGTITGSPTTGGTFPVVITVTDSDGSTGSTDFSWSITNTVTVTNPGTQTSVVGSPITALPIAATDSSSAATLSYSDNGTLPPGLHIGAGTGRITGTPTTAGTYPVVITVTDNAGFSGSASFNWTTGSTVTVTNPGAQSNVSGTAIAPLTISASDNSPTATLSYSAGGTLPPGLVLGSATGKVTGTPTRAGTSAVVVTVTDSNGSQGTADFSWTITNTVTVTNPGSKSGAVGTAITPVAITATDSSASATLAYSAGGTLPPGLAIASGSGSITGTPTTSGVYTVTVTATDNAGYSGHTSFTWTITGGPTVTKLKKTSGPGAGNTRVKVIGTGLTGASKVYFGSIPATKAKVNKKGTFIITYSPAETAGTVDVTVVTPKGTSATSSADQFTFLGPKVTKVSPNTGSIAGGTHIQITGTNMKGATQVMFGSVAVTPNSASPNGKTVTVVTPAHAAGTVNVTVTTPGGTSPVVSADQYTYH
jgi:hypothetical protein